MKVIIS